ncbi:tetratricopeptide repeat protein [Methylomonas sp. AM2-LC]|uniref:O-linked N-acetylglucosamine transferase, SPINDLY family protein n=1 Tax=Methylomonas sp. AM2-LC TaxID=3153301 RepID=UPI0032645ED4
MKNKSPSPKHIAQFQQAAVLQQAGKLPEAALILKKLLSAYPSDAALLAELGTNLLNQGQYQLAESLLARSLGIAPEQPGTQANRGIALSELNRGLEALACFDRALALRPDFALAHYNKGNVLRELHRFAEAVASYDAAIKIDAAYGYAYINRGIALHELKHFHAALSSYERGMVLLPAYEDAFYNYANTLQQLQAYAEAAEFYQKAIALRPNFIASYCGLGVALQELKQYPAALTQFDLALALNPHYDCLPGYRFTTQMLLCDWRDFELETLKLCTAINDKQLVATPFTSLLLTDNPQLQQNAAHIWTQQNYPPNHLLPAISPYNGHERIRVAYFSADFRNHAVASLTARLFELHDRSRFEIVAFSFGPTVEDEMRTRLQAGFDHFYEIGDRSDVEAAEFARQLEIDIAVDLGGHTAHCRTGVFACRAAPLQVNYLGYSGTMGAEYMDYLIADPVLIPPETQPFYTEQLVYLPDSFLVNDNQRVISDRVFSRQEMDLPATGVVFCCFNHHFKITPEVFVAWMRILQAVPGSVLWLSNSPHAADNLRMAAQAQGISADRLIFAQRLPCSAEHLARHRLADLFLDTCPYNAHTTAADALWAGLPVLTCAGEAFASRVAASLLSALDLPELIVNTPQAYEEQAIELALQPEKLAKLKAKLAENRLNAALFDTERYTKNLEAAFIAMHKRNHAGLAPEHLKVM